MVCGCQNILSSFHSFEWSEVALDHTKSSACITFKKVPCNPVQENALCLWSAFGVSLGIRWHLQEIAHPLRFVFWTTFWCERALNHGWAGLEFQLASGGGKTSARLWPQCERGLGEAFIVVYSTIEDFSFTSCLGVNIVSEAGSEWKSDFNINPTESLPIPHSGDAFTFKKKKLHCSPEHN